MPNQFIVRSTLPAREIPKCSVGELLEKFILKTAPEKLMMVNAATEQKQTYGELNQIARELATALLELGVDSNDFSMFYATNSLDYFDLYMALAYLGLPFSPSTPVNGPYETCRQLQDLNAKVMIISADRISVIKQMLDSDSEQSRTISELKLLIVMDGAESNPDYVTLQQHTKGPRLIRTFSQVLSLGRGRPLATVPHFPVLNPEDDPFVIAYTSGTTGLPKGAILSHRSFISIVLSMANIDFMEQSNSTAHLYPIGHITGTLFMASYLLYQSLAVMYPSSGDIRALLMQSIAKYQINILPIVQTSAQNLYLNRDRFPSMFDLSSLRYMAFGGSKIGNETVHNGLIDKYKVQVIEFYGATELMVGVAAYGPEQYPYGCAGNLTANSEMKIIDLVTGKSLPANQCGEIMIRSPNCFVGYRNNPKATSETIDPEGWYRSGDVGYYDEQGRLFVTDRIKELIKYKGWSIAPAEIENFLMSHPAVEGVCVLGIPHQTEGSHLRAYVRLRPGQSATESELVNFVKENMGYQKRLNNGVRFVKEEIPRTAIGKVDRKYFKNLIKDEPLLIELAEPELV